MIRVCSGFSPAGYREYGRRFLDTFDKHWPAAVDLRVYVEEAVPMPRDACRMLWDIPGARAFYDRHANNAAAQGKVPQPGWKERERQKGYSFRHDAYKFFKQIFIPEAAATDLADGDILVWLDADVVTFKDVPATMVPDLLGDADVCYLGRDRSHSEIGFWAVRINAKTHWFLTTIAEIYRSDMVFALAETHSAFVWDYARRSACLRERNLTPGGHGHVWMQSPLRQWTDHLKGGRKGMGRSPERRVA